MFSAMPVMSAGTYDPWVDVNHDGHVNVLDLIKVTDSLGSSGDPALNVTIANPTLNVNVTNPTTNGKITNWPNATNTLVWDSTSLSPGVTLYSPSKSADGFSYLHVLAAAFGIPSGATVALRVIGVFGQGVDQMQVCNLILNLSQSTVNFTIPVPSQYFYFGALTAASGVSMLLNYYLTWG